MLDKLALRTDQECNIHELLEEFSDLHHVILRVSSFFKTAICLIKDSNKKLIIKVAPTREHLLNVRIELNPSYWENYNEIDSTLSRYFDTSKLEVARIDHAVDIERNITLLRHSLRVKFKRNWQMYSEGRSKKDNGFYLGVMPEMYCIYDKKSELRKKNKTPELLSTLPEHLSRIEIRQTKGKVPIKHFHQIPELVSYNPFEKLIHYSFEGLGRSKKGEILKMLMDDMPMSQIYPLLNEHNNFSRNFNEHMTQNNFVEDLTSKYRENLGHFSPL